MFSPWFPHLLFSDYAPVDMQTISSVIIGERNFKFDEHLSAPDPCKNVITKTLKKRDSKNRKYAIFSSFGGVVTTDQRSRTPVATDRSRVVSLTILLTNITIDT